MKNMKYNALIKLILVLCCLVVPHIYGSGQSQTTKIISPAWVSDDVPPYCWGIAAGHIFDDNSTVILAGSANSVIGYDMDNGTRVWQSPELNGNVRKIAIGNVSGDNRPEVLATTHDGHLYIIDPRENIILLDWDKSHFTNGAIFGLQIADLDNDGINEIVIGTGTASIGVYNYNAGILFTKGLTMVQDAVFEVGVGDVDGDGRKDIVFVDWRGIESTVRVLDYYYGQFTQKYISPFIPGILSALKVSDINHDGIAEIIVGSGDGNIWVISLGNASGGSTAVQIIPVGSMQILSVAVGDFEGDGVADIACTASNGYEGYAYILDTEKKIVKFTTEKLPPDIGFSNSAIFYRKEGSLKELFMFTETGVPDNTPGKVLMYRVKNAELGKVSYAPEFPEINQTVNFYVTVFSTAANAEINVTLNTTENSKNITVGMEVLKNTRANTEYNISFHWIPRSGGYHNFVLLCNADGEIENISITICVAIQLEVYLTITNHCQNVLLEPDAPLWQNVTKGEVLDLTIRIVNHAPYSLFSVGVNVYLDDNLLLAKKFDLSTSEAISFKLDTLLISNSTYTICIKTFVTSVFENVPRIYTTYNITGSVKIINSISDYLPMLIPLCVVIILSVITGIYIRYVSMRYRKMWLEEPVLHNKK